MFDYSCKICGGTLHPQGKGLAVCDSCRTLQTMSGIDDAARAQLLDRATYLRRQGKFTQAANAIEKLLNADIRDAEAYWQAMLCRYGVIFEPDAAAGYRISCHRMRQGNVLMDADYKKALSLASQQAAAQYKRDAAMIADIQRDCEAVMARCKPWDVAIVCDEGGQSAHQAAVQLYDQLRRSKMNVYLASKTAAEYPNESAVGLSYAAVHTAWAMVVVVSSQREAEGNQLRNLWTTYLSLNRKARPRRLIVAYQRMQMFDLPEELASLEDIQCLDGHGAILDLAYGVERYRPVEEPENQDPHRDNLRQAYLHLAAGEYFLAHDYAAAILQKDKKYVPALVCDFLATNEIPCADDTGLLKLKYPMRSYPAFGTVLSAMPKGSEQQKHIFALEAEHNAQLYQKACEILERDRVVMSHLEYAIDIFQGLTGVPGSAAKLKEARKKKAEFEENEARKAREAEMEATYRKLLPRVHRVESEYEVYALVAEFQKLGSYRDSREIVAELYRKHKEREAEKRKKEALREERVQKCKTRGLYGMVICIVVDVLLVVLTLTQSPLLINALDGIDSVLPLGVWLLPILTVLLYWAGAYPYVCLDYVKENDKLEMFMLAQVGMPLVVQIFSYILFADDIGWLVPDGFFASLLMIGGTGVVGFFGMCFIGTFISNKWEV